MLYGKLKTCKSYIYKTLVKYKETIPSIPLVKSIDKVIQL